MGIMSDFFNELGKWFSSKLVGDMRLHPPVGGKEERENRLRIRSGSIDHYIVVGRGETAISI